MSSRSLRTSFERGVEHLRTHPQLWVTALTGLIIFSAFIFTSYRFAAVAMQAQEELINVRIGSILDAFVLFAPDVLYEPDTMRSRMGALRVQNPTIESFSIVAQHGNTAWRIYVSDGGGHEGSVQEDVPAVYGVALAQPGKAFTEQTLVQGERYFTTARAIVGSAGQVEALAVTRQRLSEADRQLREDMLVSYLLLGVVLIVIMGLFFRHAHIVDFAHLYKKQLEIDELKDSFLGMASHELKSPLTVIRGYIEYLQEGKLDEPTRQEFMRRIALSADELRQLVDDILDVSRIEMGRLRFSPDYVQPVTVCEEVIETYADAAHKKELTLSLEVSDEARGASVRVDRGRLKQVMINLVSNAIKYTLHGKVTIGINSTADTVELSVRDSGVGMTAEEVQKLFTKFYRVEAPETKTVTGTGLGLWITKYMIEHMQGSVSVESIKGEGSRFVVRFPRVHDTH